MSDQLKAYLLDQLTPEEQSRLEERMFVDDDFFDLMLDTENDLVDAYAAGKLSPGDAAEFAKRFAAGVNGHRRIAVARALFAREQNAGSKGPWPFRKIHLQQALAVAAALVIVAVAGWLYKGHVTTPVPAGRIAAQPLQGRGLDGKIVSIFLTSTVTRERNAVPSFVLPGGAEQLRVTTSVPMVTHDMPLHAELRTTTGNLLWQGTPQSWDGDSPVFLIPTNQVPSGAAELDVFAEADRRLAGVYPLRFERF